MNMLTIFAQATAIECNSEVSNCKQSLSVWHYWPLALAVVIITLVIVFGIKWFKKKLLS